MAYSGQTQDGRFNTSVQGSVASSSTLYRYSSLNQAQPFTFSSTDTITITSNVLTVATTTSPNSYVAGQQVQLFGLVAASFLNGVTVTVLSTGLSSTQFEANFVHANYGPDTSNTNGFTQGALNNIVLGVLSQEDPSRNAQNTFTAMDVEMTITPAADTYLVGQAPVVWPSGGSQGQNVDSSHLGTGRVFATTPVQTFQVTSNVLTVTPQAGFRYSPWIIGTTLTFRNFTTATFLNPATITSTQVASNVLTVSCTNSFSNGQTIKLRGLTTSTFLNNQVVTITTATGANFTAPFTHANYGPTADTGTANPIATVTSSSYASGGNSAAVCTFGTHANVGLTTDTTGEIVGGTFYSVTGQVVTANGFSAGNTVGVDMMCSQVVDTGLAGSINNVCGLFFTQMGDQGAISDNQYCIYIQDQTQTRRNTVANVWAIFVQGGTSRFAGLATNYQTITTTYTATTNDYTLFCNGTFTVTLPTATTFLSPTNNGVKVGQIYVIKNIGTGTITVSSAANIDGSTSFVMSTQYQSVSVQWDGTQYWVI